MSAMVARAERARAWAGALMAWSRRALAPSRSWAAAFSSGAACWLALASFASYSFWSLSVQTLGFLTGLPSLPMTTWGSSTTGAGAWATGAGVSATGAGVSATGAGVSATGAGASGTTTGACSTTVAVESSANAAGAMATAPRAVAPVSTSVTATRRRGLIVVIMSVSLTCRDRGDPGDKDDDAGPSAGLPRGNRKRNARSDGG